MRHFAIAAVALLFAHPVEAQLAAPNDAGVAFGHVHLTVTDVELHKKLWTRLFDGVPVEREGYTAVRVPGTLVFFTEGEPTAPSRETAMDHVGFKVRDVGEVLADWRMLGYEVDTELTGAEAVSVAYITMPNGTRVELQQDPGLAGKAEMHHVHFFNQRHDELPLWYTEVFGATELVHGDLETTVEIPGSQLSFSNSDEARAPTENTAIDHIGFEVEDWDAFVEMLRGRGVELWSK